MSLEVSEMQSLVLALLKDTEPPPACLHTLLRQTAQEVFDGGLYTTLALTNALFHVLNEKQGLQQEIDNLVKQAYEIP